MRHRKKGYKLGRSTKQRKTLFKGLIQSLILNEQIKTTEAKVKAIKGLADKLITKAKAGSLAARRQVLAFLPDKKAVHKLFDVIVPQFKNRSSGFTRFIRLGRRRGDNAMMAKLEFVDKIKKSDSKPSEKPGKKPGKNKKSANKKS